jgi:hypothetical protein
VAALDEADRDRREERVALRGTQTARANRPPRRRTRRLSASAEAGSGISMYANRHSKPSTESSSSSIRSASMTR